MLKIKINGSKVGKVVAKGTTLDIIAELTLAVMFVYRAMKRNDEEKARAFKEAFTKAITDDESPVWK